MDRTVSPTYTGDKGAILSNIERLTRSLSSDIQAAPQVRTAMAETLQAQEGALPRLAQQRGALIEELFSADKELAAKYADPTSEVYIENPMAREAAVSRKQAAIYGGIAGLNTQIATRQRLLGDALERGMALFEAGQKAKQMELDNLYKQLERLDAQELIADQRAARAQQQKNWEAEMQMKQQQELMKATRELIKQQEVPKGVIEDLTALEQAKRMIDELEVLGKRAAAGALGRVKKTIQRAVPGGFFPEVTALEQATTQYSADLAKALSASDPSGQQSVRLFEIIKRDLMPKVEDSQQEVDIKIKGLRQALANKAEALYSVYGVAPSFNPYAFQGAKQGGFVPRVGATTSARPTKGFSQIGKQELDPSLWEPIE